MNYEDSSDDDMSFCDESENLFDDDGADMESMGNNSTRTLKGVREDVMVSRELFFSLSLSLN